MAKAIIEGYGKVEFDPTNYDNNLIDLYNVAIVDPNDNWWIAGEEHYTDESDYRSALRNTYGREVMDEQVIDGTCIVVTDIDGYIELRAIYHTAYVIDNEEE